MSEGIVAFKDEGIKTSEVIFSNSIACRLFKCEEFNLTGSARSPADSARQTTAIQYFYQRCLMAVKIQDDPFNLSADVFESSNEVKSLL